MSGSSFTFTLEIPRRVLWRKAEYATDRHFDREDFLAFLWQTFGDEGELFPAGEGLLGIHEGTLLSEEAFDAGLETESWMVDSGEAPRERDWMESQEFQTAVIYFGTEAAARESRSQIKGATDLPCGEIEEQKAEDWDAAWKASFQGVSVPPNWEILPPWVESPTVATAKVIRINPGAGFGTGTHETTQLCLQAVAFALREHSELPKGVNVLDFGSGSGILSIAAAVLGANVDGVEIDPLAIDNANENASLNSLKGKVRFEKTIADLGTPDKKYPVVIANILRPVLIEFASLLVSKLERPGKVVLSGLIATDLPDVITRYSGLLGGTKPQIFERGEWRALVFEAN